MTEMIDTVSSVQSDDVRCPYSVTSSIYTYRVSEAGG